MTFASRALRQAAGSWVLSGELTIRRWRDIAMSHALPLADYTARSAT